jgi:hypothetical protein
VPSGVSGSVIVTGEVITSTPSCSANSSRFAPLIRMLSGPAEGVAGVPVAPPGSTLWMSFSIAAFHRRPGCSTSAGAVASSAMITGVPSWVT